MTMPNSVYRRRGRIAGAIDPRAVAVGFVPTDLTGLLVWFRASSIGLSDGAAISTWADESGNANDLTQPSTQKPTYKTNIINGYPVVRFDATDDFLTLDSAISNSTFTYFIVLRRNSYLDHCILIATDTTYDFLQFAETWFVGGTFYSKQMTEDVFYLKTCVTDVSNILRYTNGSLDYTESPAGGFGFAGLGISGFIPNDMDIAELFMYNSALSESNRTLANTYLMNKYGLT
jgi:hypothetical protein